MPELPDVTAYQEGLERHVVGRALEKVKVVTPFLLRSFDPPLTVFEGKEVRGIRRIGKRLVFVFDDALFLVLHLMIAGRLRWRRGGAKLGMGSKIVVATFQFAHGILYFTEAGTRKRASLTAIRGEEALRALDPGGVDPMAATFEQFKDALTRENHTVKRSLTDPHLFSGIGNAYSDEILHRAGLSPMRMSDSLPAADVARLFAAIRATLIEWRDALIADVGDGFPERVTAFRPGMRVHGRFGQPCPVCHTAVQRIRYAANEANYCPTCQTEGRLLADRGLSRLLKGDWPRTLDELERRKRERR